MTIIKHLCRYSPAIFLFVSLKSFAQVSDSLPETTPFVKPGSFPISVQFTPVPSGKGWKDEKPPLTDQVIEETIHNIILHGFTNLSFGAFGSGGATPKALTYGQKLGMKIDLTSNGVQLFKRNIPPRYSVYSPEYIDSVKQMIEPVLGNIKKIKSPHSIFPFMDEPFHADTTSFDYSLQAKNEFQNQYGYSMPLSYLAAKRDPAKYLDFINFQSLTFPAAWKQIYKEVKAFDPRPKIVMTHDSHNTMGGGVKSDAKYAIDDVFHWGADFADVFVYDIYPYTMFDYRYGELGKFPKPRISQMHYTMAQMRNLTSTYGKELGFWLGTFNESWFRRYINPEMRKQYWGERELAYTAIANGSNFIITGLNIPQDAQHWDDLGKGLRAIQKVGSEILAAPKVKSRACFLFPRSQYVQLNEEYFNVGLTFELCMRAFGEMDIIHEEQIVDAKMNGYDILVLADVKMLPAKVAKYIEKFVHNGGIVITDCVPQMDEYMKPLQIMARLLGVSSASTDRVVQNGQWNPFSMLPPQWAHGLKPPPPEPVKKFDKAAGTAFGLNYDFNVVTPRDCKVSDGTVAFSMASGQPALIQNQAGKGKTYLLGFCLQDTYFQTWKTDDVKSRSQLYDMMHKVFDDTKVSSHSYSSNPDMEVTVRANDKEAFVFVINHESARAITDVTLGHLGFDVGEIMDVDWGRTVDFTQEGNKTKFTVLAVEGTGTGVTRLLRITPKKK
ncbi:beta-galactosidase trimerization domain-containing protein [Daejeonella sp.]|uniref:beta-galactosidase trimerization domain-containing protein n=1 Tax=Daejeonella sp. TaxID=2805397 RepID=UPI0030C5C4BE